MARVLRRATDETQKLPGFLLQRGIHLCLHVRIAGGSARGHVAVVDIQRRPSAALTADHAQSIPTRAIPDVDPDAPGFLAGAGAAAGSCTRLGHQHLAAYLNFQRRREARDLRPAHLALCPFPGKCRCASSPIPKSTNVGRLSNDVVGRPLSAYFDHRDRCHRHLYRIKVTVTAVVLALENGG